MMLRAVVSVRITSWCVFKYLCVLLAVSSVQSSTTRAVPTTSSMTSRTCPPLQDPSITCPSIQKQGGVCTDTNAGNATLNNFINICKQENILDLIFVIDRSVSITCEMFHCSVDVIKRLIRYLSSTGDLVIGERYSHVSIITYGVQDTVVYDGIGVSGQAEKLTSCNLQSKFPDNVIPTAGSVLYTVLERAETIFKKSDQVRKDSNSPRANKRVVLLVSDGEETDEGSDAKEIAKIIRELPATILSMAQDGLWLNNEREKLLMSLADDSQHCACRSQWSQALEEYEKEIPDTKEVYVRAVDMVTGNCSPGKCKWDCACEAISNTYRCHKFPTTTIPPTTTTVPPPTPVPSWLWPAVGAGGGLLFLIILITCCVCCCRNGRNSDPPPYPGPELPTPPVPRRRRKLEIMGADNTYGNWEPIDNEYAEADANGMNGTQEFYVSPETEEIHEVDHDLPGWTDFLVEEIRLKNLIHLGVHNVNKERWSMTPGVKVQRKEVKDIYKIFVDPKATRKSKPRIDMKLGGNRYRIDMGESSEGNHILATRKMKDGREQVAVVVREEHYLLVGISGADQKMVLLASCQDLSSHFQGIYGTNDL